jgi:hypothetical protein
VSTLQHRLSDYLQCELYHSLGSYRVAKEQLTALQERLARAGGNPTASEEATDTSNAVATVSDPIPRDGLHSLTDQTRRYNTLLHSSRHASNGTNEGGARAGTRHPIPTRLPLTGCFTLPPPSDADPTPVNPWVRPMGCAWISDFYTAATSVLSRNWVDPPKRGDGDWRPFCFRQSLITWRNGSDSPISDEERRVLRLKRYRYRLAQAHVILSDDPPTGGHGGQIRTESSTESDDRLVERIAADNLSTGSGSLSLFVVEALVEAHLSMHAVEACQSTPLKQYAVLANTLRSGGWLHRVLDRCIALDTFAYCAGRTAPWLFAEDREEGRKVFENVSQAWQNVVPTRCIWIATQLSLLALHRRAYARMLKGGRGDKVNAYNDFHKLQGLIRDAERRVQRAPIHVEGALEFLAGLDAQAHYHTGELYRKEHAQRPARKHFQAATHRLEQLRDGENTTAAMKDVLVDSRWKVDLQVAHGKASYEMGRHKESLCWHLRGWRAFLELLAGDTKTEASTGDISKAIDWLVKVQYEPELRKAEIELYLTPVIEQFKRIAVSHRLGALAADILLRLGHLLFTLNVDRGIIQPDSGSAHVDAGDRIERTLALSCLRKAVECDNHTTLVGADLLKVRARFREWFKGELPEEYDRLLVPPDLVPVGDQWPGGGDDYESLARITEYLMLKTHVCAEHTPPRSKIEAEDYKVARHLLLNFFMHTDSINVRKSQVHRFLMRSPDSGTPPCYESNPAIEFVCVRRYSSAFPLLPRPSAFRALGGGYFVRLHPSHAEQDPSEPGSPPAPTDLQPAKPYGIVVDPGVDYVENLYRAGFSLSDVNMVIVTHDHVDHLGSLDPLLSLLHTRAEIRARQSHGEIAPPIQVIVSRSVKNRYERVHQLTASNDFRCLDDFMVDDHKLREIVDFPREFGILAMSSKEIDDVGHLDLSEEPACGVCFCGPRGVSLAITSDTPAPPSQDDHEGWARWLQTWSPALQADVLIAHVSSVPLTELRKLAELDANVGAPRQDERGTQGEAGRQLCDTITRIHSRDQQQLDAATRMQVAALAATACALVQAVHRRATATELEIAIGNVERDANALRSALAGRESQHLMFVQFALEAMGFAIQMRRSPTDPLELERIRGQLERANPDLKGQLEFAMWLRAGGADGPVADLVGSVPESWRPPQPHNFLHGILRWARAYRQMRGEQRPGLLVLGELSEELGTMRGKVAARLNEIVLAPPDRPGKPPDPDEDRFYALTSDIGLQLFVVPLEEEDSSAPQQGTPPCASPSQQPSGSLIKVLCTNCSLDTDRATEERYHAMHRLREVCVKGENEGIFYNCKEHDPSQQKEPIFLEQLERFDIFGH